MATGALAEIFEQRSFRTLGMCDPRRLGRNRRAREMGRVMLCLHKAIGLHFLG